MNSVAEALAERVKAINALIAAYAREKVTIVAATKTRSAEEINLLAEAGVWDYGENRVQEWQEKHGLVRPDMRFHMIGRLQTNKVAAMAREVALVHSLDRPSLAQALDRAGQKRGKPISALLEVSIAGEAQKGGVSLELLDEWVFEWSRLPGIALRGMMVMAPLEGGETARRVFREGRAVFDRLSRAYEGFHYLSMGMSGDLAEALQEGSNMIRPGSALFGPRQPGKNMG